MPLSAKIVACLLKTFLPYPKTVMIDPANICQLRCPLCSTGLRSLNYDSTVMPLEVFREIIAKVPFAAEIELFKNGEPFLNPDILAMIRYASARRLRVSTSTNFSFSKPDAFFDELVLSGLDKLIVSLDGTSQESYSRYRKGGDYDLVLSNVKRLAAARKRLGSPAPAIVWQFLVNRFNEGEIASAESMCSELGIELDLQPIGLADDLPDVEPREPIEEKKRHWLPENGRYVADCYKGSYRPPLFKGICTQLFTRMVVTADGKVLPCCWAEDRDSIFGNLLAEPFEKLWHNDHYLNSRLLFLVRNFTPPRTVCSGCNNFSKNPSLKDKLRFLYCMIRGSAVRKKRKPAGSGDRT